MKRILIVKLSALGDVLRTTSLLRPLAARHPRARIAWLTSREAAPLLETNPWIAALGVVDPASAVNAIPEGPPGPGHPISWKARGSALDRASAEPGACKLGPFDLVLSLEEDAAAARLAEESAQGELVGVVAREGRLSYTPSSARYYDMSLLNRSADGSLAHADALKAANSLTYAELWLKVLGLPIPRDRNELRPILVLSEEDRTFARTLGRNAGLAGRPAPIGLNPGAGRRWPSKQLSVESAARLARTLHRRFGRPILLFGGRDESSRNKTIAGLARRAGVPLVDPGTKQDLRSFAALVELCEAVVTTDTLALHVAAALGKKTFALVGPTSAAELDVFGRGEKIAPALACSCFYRPRCRLAKTCLDRLPAGRVADAVGRWLSAGGRRGRGRSPSVTCAIRKGVGDRRLGESA
ncbi:MAG: glycosyltransferase family 9 protein [Elusimicrobia bacterium]|nr:glycosyltransferase family 9 protein [Elusimicrobiota bacterium]